MSSRSAFDDARARTLKTGKGTNAKQKNVIYWMSRDQRVEDNWALLHAQELALKSGGIMAIAFCLQTKGFLGANRRHYDFMIAGLKEIEQKCHNLNIPFQVYDAEPAVGVIECVSKFDAHSVVCDFSPLKIGRLWRDALVAKSDKSVSIIQVDAHNVVPIWMASQKQEVGARTIRNKINSQLPRFLTDFPRVIKQQDVSCIEIKKINWSELEEKLQNNIDQKVAPVTWCMPGQTAGLAALEAFCTDGRLAFFAEKRNDPNVDALSNLSPYFHFGMIAPQRAALRVKSETSSKYSQGIKAFLEESIVRRELADNFCYYNSNYDSLDCAAQWARDSLDLHTADKREFIYTCAQFENAQTHEDIWNAAQTQLVQTGKMHGFLRMYWCKKILEWTSTPADALSIAIYLNDKYSLDGRDPNGYTGIAWSICGIHDQGWKEREIFGKIRYMNYNGCKRKFDIAAFVRKYLNPSGPMDQFLSASPSSSGSKATKRKKIPENTQDTDSDAKKKKASSSTATSKRT
mmetsp:Transcript_15446/g.23256  ORF Transcript_15446/g.23256 Transcript_15446/m.23256 type:complete len:517 (+) Transcript_15446:195-1745(+)|eukprot:CAMPEP_0197322260 /NCGR_PEP_ID=MMETSP0891-20130614/69006_1 /TAXON_ID=44058 ORGANISM="Aureoumbra lagunensis, Strain CCMP1510" /NCGR_SAMPLE_ID=MMETSP0891 /ASSEMBLY_ACC=CAM_ASM_000534 /LENGTH=516 /DNA_ID=CAMNT_0042814579 /DNA_START=120 /DNA_END=1670 /DNA_ORIENTATION=-